MTIYIKRKKKEMKKRRIIETREITNRNKNNDNSKLYIEKKK